MDTSALAQSLPGLAFERRIIATLPFAATVLIRSLRLEGARSMRRASGSKTTWGSASAGANKAMRECQARHSGLGACDDTSQLA
jgi:hypothetical protein